MALLQIKDISLSFGGLKAVDQVSLAVNQGEIVSLIGPNGAGKTTIFNILTGIYRIEGGELLFEGAPIHNKSPQDIVKAGIARTFQNIRLFRRMRVIENVLIGSNGAGKTTTLGCITGLVAARSGAIVYRGLPITNYPAHKVVGLGVSLAPEGREVFPALTVDENLRLGRYSKKRSKQGEAPFERVYGLFPRLRERRLQAAGTLSGGSSRCSPLPGP